MDLVLHIRTQVLAAYRNGSCPIGAACGTDGVGARGEVGAGKGKRAWDEGRKPVQRAQVVGDRDVVKRRNVEVLDLKRVTNPVSGECCNCRGSAGGKVLDGL